MTHDANQPGPTKAPGTHSPRQDASAATDEEGFSNLLNSMRNDRPEAPGASGEGAHTESVAPQEIAARDLAQSPELPHDSDVVSDADEDQGDVAKSLAEQERGRAEALSAAIASDPEKSAVAIIVGEFSENGSGNLGNLFRLMKSLEGEELVSAWSNILELAEILWARDRQEAALELMKAANVSLSAPDIFADRVRDSIERAQNFVLADRADKRFEDGDLEGALGIARSLTGDLGEEYREELRLRQKLRKRNRIFAFSFSGLAMVALAAVSIHGVTQFRNLIENPPSVELPEMPGGELWEDLRNSKLTRETPPSLTEALEAEADARSSTSQKIPEIAPSGTDAIDAPRTGEVISDAAAPDTVETPSTPQAQLAPVQQGSKSPAAEVIYNCALGQAVSRRAIEIVVASETRQGAATVERFVTKVNSACAALSVSQASIDQVIATIPSERIDSMAQNVVGISR